MEFIGLVIFESIKGSVEVFHRLILCCRDKTGRLFITLTLLAGKYNVDVPMSSF